MVAVFRTDDTPLFHVFLCGNATCKTLPAVCEIKCITDGGYRLNVRSCTPLRHPTSPDHAADSCRGIPWPPSNVSSCGRVAQKVGAANENRVERVDSAANQVALALLLGGSYSVITSTRS